MRKTVVALGYLVWVALCLSWAIRAWGWEDTKHTISALDATYALQMVVGIRHPTPLEVLACDVSGDGTVSAYDASLILQFVVGLIHRFPAAERCGSDWLFYPNPLVQHPGSTLVLPKVTLTSCTMGAILGGCATGQDFLGILIGDCTGSWHP